MKTTFAIPARLLTPRHAIRLLALLVLALCFSGCASTGGPPSRHSEPMRSAAVADDWDRHSAQNRECTIALFRWSF